jgi:L-fucose isomerase
MNNYPQIGIRPIIDGRRGGIENRSQIQTMNLAKLAAKFYEENLRYPEGSRVQCVIADTCIGGVKRTAATVPINFNAKTSG